MNDEIRIVIERVSGTEQTVINRNIVQTYNLLKPRSIAEFGLSHQEQIALLTKLQNEILAEQSSLASQKRTVCPRCGQKVSKNGFMTSVFHSVFSDHKVRLQKHRCTNPECNWQSTPTTLTEFGSDTHPDVAKLQCEQGIAFSYRVAQKNLELLNGQRRSVNNHVQIRATTNRIGESLASENGRLPDCGNEPTAQLVIHLERGFIPTRSHHQAEVLLGMIYELNKLPVDLSANDAIQPTYVVSALADDQKTFKDYLVSACRKKGLSTTTQVYGLVDQASYWSPTLEILKPYCQRIERLLDWLHISKQFDLPQQGLSTLSMQCLEQAKLDVWQGDVDEALMKLEFMLANLPSKKQQGLLRRLQTYLQSNRNDFVNYKQREQENKPFSSEAIAIHLDTLINSRMTRQSQSRMTLQGVHNLLQIRAAMASGTWQKQWDSSKESLRKNR